MILKFFSCRGIKKSIFFKTKPSIKNLSDRKLDMVPNFAPLSAFDLKMKIERQVQFSIALSNVFFKLVKQPKAKNAFWS